MLASEQIKNLVVAFGTAIGDTFDIPNLRYHKIIIATDADVDGAHIRTLILTLFYRYFRPLIDGGHVYIAQPPLYKIKKGKETLYAYTDAELTKITNQQEDISFYDSKSESVIESDRLAKILEYVDKYNNYSSILQSKGLHPKITEALLVSSYKKITDNEEEAIKLLKSLEEKSVDYHVKHSVVNDKKQTEVTVDKGQENLDPQTLREIAKSNEFTELFEIHKELDTLTAGVMVVKNGKKIAIKDVKQLMESLKTSSSVGLSLQRYKGLGEMNAEELWETTMDPAKRILKQVNIEDAQEADKVFDMLMGDDVPARKSFIQSNAKMANLDI